MKKQKNHAFQEYAEQFKSILVKRYNWKVGDASNFDVNNLHKHFEKGRGIYEAYQIIFDKPQDLLKSV